ncbi:MULTISPECIES: efflux RND transporter permease subunit [Parabacteroides]|jgi:HAE1 family hydrophobic/amphiphilic exporter-1|uniref:Hydrophobe/amphiphile efflux-1 (HAE1) family RND transporter n=1 Tax=Parabacteroides gordonii MS-1 = DSM 23371 TaxID=1203610 RepID=A0A0F5JQL0_9BACT|nr:MULTISPECIES: efflux RND transporter permease subunit [Parabacteroides]KKB48236.1 hydrophobe/amphiphile efflux-1 (HAE1) family RND transporter [Parabacteroides sp. HGS0025]KKB59707.1 hydrophobe/amphiphile efflux-1 (HAE1) family RND transporter [Parabacteroides gordonii MS-1 = DSM 23371]MCA5583890.1 efflux RND transporter permease subunit [Parabacteroides gordonii]RGP09521.1 hydrophobe/amphiphile efflux-1 family RND transporter [Parabacteroides gordonii]
MKLDRFINRPVLSTVISILIVILGILGLFTLPITQYPDIAPPTVSVRATYTGANAQTVLNSVIAPLEDQINGVENMMYMTSNASNNGSADISIYFKQGTDPDMAAVNVQNRVSMAQGLLPAEVTKIGVTTQKRQNSMLVVFAVYDAEDRYDQKFLENYAKINLIPEVQRVPGVGDANVLGTDYSMRIWLKPDVMAQYKLVPNDVSNVLAEQNVEAAPGSFGEQGNQSFQYTIRYKGRLQTAEEFDNIVVKALPDGEVLRLKDIADIELGRLTYNYVNKVNGHNAVACIVYQMPGTNATETINNIQDLLVKSESTMPPGMKVEVSMNANDFLYASIHEVLKTLLEAFILVFIVVYVFLQDLRSTLIPAIAIPVALIGTFFLLSLIGFSINLLTLCAMVLAIAIVVDDAIVVVEGVHAKLDQGYKSAKQASIDAMSELGGAIVSITLVMMSVFIPVSFMGGTAGIFYRQFGVTMAIAIGLSALNALTLSPALCAIFLKPHDEHAEKKTTFVSRFHTSFNVAYDSLLKSYKKRVLFFIQKKWLAFGTVIASVALLVFFMQVTPTGMVPNEDMGTIMGAVTLPPGASQERTIEIMERVDSLIASDPAVKSRTAITGFSFIGGQGPSYGSFIIKLKDWDERSMTQSAEVVYGSLFMRAQKVVKDAQVLFFTPPMIPGYSASSDIELNMQDKTGGSLEKFFEVSKDYMAALTARPEIKSAQTTFNPNFPQYMIDIDAAACKKVGISPSDILMTLQGYYGGLYASNFNRFGKMYRVMVQADPAMRANMESLKNIKVRNGNEMAPISQFITIEKVYGPDIISRFNMYTSLKVMVAPADGFTSGQALKALEEVASTTLPAGFGYELGGMAREEAETSGSTTGLIFVLCFVFVYLLLSAQYESYVLPLAVLLSIPFGLMGSFLFVQGWAALGSIPALKMILGTMSNNIYMQIALIMLMGLLAKNAILIVEFALDRRRMGMSITWAAVLGAAARLRPILMTSLAMVVGLLPMMFAFGVGAHGNRTLGTAAIGGMFVGMIFQILIVPALFVVFQYLQEKVKPIEWEDLDNSDLNTEIEQYAKK